MVTTWCGHNMEVGVVTTWCGHNRCVIAYQFFWRDHKDFLTSGGLVKSHTIFRCFGHNPVTWKRTTSSLVSFPYPILHPLHQGSPPTLLPTLLSTHYLPPYTYSTLPHPPIHDPLNRLERNFSSKTSSNVNVFITCELFLDTSAAYRMQYDEHAQCVRSCVPVATPAMQMATAITIRINNEASRPILKERALKNLLELYCSASSLLTCRPPDVNTHTVPEHMRTHP